MERIGTQIVSEVRPVAHSSLTPLPVPELAQLAKSLAQRLLFPLKIPQRDR